MSAAALPSYDATSKMVGGSVYTATVDPNTQRVYWAGSSVYAVKVMDTDGSISIIAGSTVGSGYADGLGSYASFSNKVWQLFFCRRDNFDDIIYAADTDNHLIRAMTTAGRVTTIAGGGGLGNAAGSTNAVGTYARFNGARGVACDASNGDVWLADLAKPYC